MERLPQQPNRMLSRSTTGVGRWMFHLQTQGSKWSALLLPIACGGIGAQLHDLLI